MAGKTTVNVVQVGDSATAAQNFHLKTNVDGTLSLNRGNDGASLGTVLTVASDGKVSFPSGVSSTNNLPAFQCRAWVKFNGSTGTILAAGNVSNVTRNGVGDYTITFATAMPDTDYCAIVSCKQLADASATSSLGMPGVYTTTTLRVITVEAANAARDMNTVNVSIFR